MECSRTPVCVYPELWKQGLGSTEATCGEHLAEECNNMENGDYHPQKLASDDAGASWDCSFGIGADFPYVQVLVDGMVGKIGLPKWN